MKIKNFRLVKNQSGIASMVIVMVIMTILSLIVLSMTQNSNREQRQSLDRQLNSQAFYAAESGIADAKDYIAQNPDSAPPEKKKCDHTETGAADGNQFPDKPARVNDINTQEEIRYSCVLYDRDPPNLEFDLGVSNNEIMPIQDSTNRTIKDLTITWHQKDKGTDFSGCPRPALLQNLPQQLASNCEAGMLRVALIDHMASDRQQLINNSFVAYFKPSDSPSASAINYVSASGSLEQQGALVSGGCHIDSCKVTIRDINKKKLFLQLRSLYKTNKVVISGVTTDPGNPPVNFSNAQIEIDSTGIANDILKRVRVRISQTGNDAKAVPGFVLQTTTSICKRLQIKPGVVTDGC